MSKIEAVVFDVDGTLLDTFEHIVRAFEKVLPSHGVEPDRELIRAVVGKTLVECYEILSPTVDAKLAASQHHEIQQTPEMYDLIVAYDSLRETLDELNLLGIKRAVVTNRSQPSLGLIFDHVGIAGDFEAMITPSELTKPKPDPEGVLSAAERFGVLAGSMIMVGDTHIDVRTGKNAKVRATVGVTHGFGTREELESAGADYIIDSLAELPGIIRTIEQI